MSALAQALAETQKTCASSWQAQPHQVVPEHVKPQRNAFACRADYLNALADYERAHREEIAIRCATASTAAWMQALAVSA